MHFKITTVGNYLKGYGVSAGSMEIHHRRSRLNIECVYCKKTGLDYDGLSICPVCRGKKKFFLKRPVIACAFCRGKGASDGKATICRVCHGKAFISMKMSVERCPECRGRGRITGTDLMCIRCMGKGIVELKEGDRLWK